MLAQGDPPDPALICPDGRTITYGQLPSVCSPWLGLTGGLAPRSVVMLFADASLESVLCYLSCLESRTPVLMADPAWNERAVARMLEMFRPDLVVWPSAVRNSGCPPGYRAIEHESSPRICRRIVRDDVAPHPELALLMSTSGSTGTPQAVRLSWRNLTSNAASIGAALAVRPGDRAITSLPLNHCYGLSVLNSHLASGASVVLSGDTPLGHRFWRCFEDLSVTTFAGVSFTYRAILKRLLSHWPPALRSATQSGSPMPAQLADRYVGLAEAHGARFYLMYGQTEATARMSCVDIVAEPDRVGSVGRAVPGGRFRIADTESRADSGEVVYEGPNVMLGYAGSRADLSAGDQLAGRLPTGDIGFLDGDYLYLCGRIKRIAKVAGRRVNLDELERELAREGDVAVVEVADQIVAFHTCPTTTLTERVNRVCTSLRISPTAIETVAVADFPRTTSGKVDYATLGTAQS
jgi:acyl-CoA synthetase (AMP-forming)/AMP-acid ligase II